MRRCPGCERLLAPDAFVYGGQRRARCPALRALALVAERNRERINARVLRADPCSYCGAPGGTIDHVDPLSEGGSNAADNLTAACRSCNSAKNARPLLVFMLAEVA